MKKIWAIGGTTGWYYTAVVMDNKRILDKMVEE